MSSNSNGSVHIPLDMLLNHCSGQERQMRSLYLPLLVEDNNGEEVEKKGEFVKRTHLRLQNMLKRRMLKLMERYAQNCEEIEKLAQGEIDDSSMTEEEPSPFKDELDLLKEQLTLSCSGYEKKKSSLNNGKENLNDMELDDIQK